MSEVIRSRSQVYSEEVFKRVQALVNDNRCEDEFKKKYKSLCKRSGGVLRTVGLIQFLTFLEAKGQKAKEVQHEILLSHLRQELETLDILKAKDNKSLLKTVREMSLPIYMRLTTETLRLLQWHKRISDILIEGTVDEYEGDE